MISEPDLQQFRTSLRGQLLLPREPGYEEGRKVFNAMIDRHPGMIVRCAGVADVIAAVTFATRRDLEVAVPSTGHHVAGLSVCDKGMVIDLSPMKGIHVNPATRIARVEPGVTWFDLNHELQVFGLAATGGYVGTTGVSGLTLGGGLGWMVRKHGCALDNLLSADVVTADGQFLHASSTTNPDLFWGIRGGGGNFGVVTSFEFQVHPAGTVLAGLVLHSASTARESLRFWREYETTAPEEMSNSAVLFNAPPGLPLPEVLWPHYRRVLGCSLAQAQHRFAPITADAQRHQYLAILERSAIDQHRTQPEFAQRTLHQLLHLLTACLDEVVAHGRLLNPVGVAELFHHRPVIPGREAAHHLVPNSLFERPAALE
jgi:FAD/FMN-containing dehydrogenase